MVKHKLHIALFIFMGISLIWVLSLPSAHAKNDNTNIEEVKKETREMLNSLKDYSSDKAKDAVKKTEEVLRNLDNRIDKLEKRVDDNWDDMKSGVRKTTRENLKDLRKKRLQVAEWYGSLKNSTGQAWEHLKEGFSDSYKDLYGSWVKAEKEFANDSNKK